MFVIGDEEGDEDNNAGDGTPASQTAAVENSMQPMQAQPKPAVQVVKREPIFVAEKNRSQIDKFTADGDLYQAFEAGIPLRLIEYREFEGRIKKLVYGKETVKLRQLQYVLGRDYDDFVELADANSEISKIIMSKAFD